MLTFEPADFRKGIDGFAGICKRALKEATIVKTVQLPSCSSESLCRETTH